MFWTFDGTGKNPNEGKRLVDKKKRTPLEAMRIGAKVREQIASTKAFTSQIVALTLLAFDFDGKELWQQPLGGFVSQHGPGHSPMVHGGLVFVSVDDMRLPGRSVGINRQWLYPNHP